jgi:transcription elongation factor Elf1
MSNIPFVCKKCGSETFKVTAKPKNLDDMGEATCAKCGTKMTKEEIEAQAGKIASDLLKKAFKGSGLKFK